MLIAAMFLPSLLPQGEDAEKLFQKMAKKLAEAKTLQVTFEGSVDMPEKAEIKGFLGLASAGKVSLKVEGRRSNERKYGLVSDGTKVIDFPNTGKEKERKTPDKFNELFAGLMARAGPVIGYRNWSKPPSANATLDELVPVSAFKLGKKEKVRDRQAQAITYELKHEGDDTLTVTLWIDEESHLPLKRVFRGKVKDRDALYRETYSAVLLDKKIDAKIFELPK
jgi:outer membrane lipoprotein-sorting protein